MNLAARISLGFLITAAIAILFLFFYYNGNGSLSNEAKDWADFGSYISGTVGVLAACMAVIWLIISVHHQKTELEHLKTELAASGNEQRKQTNINALAALINSSRQSIASHQNDLIALNSGEKHLHPWADDISLHDMINEEWKKLSFYQTEIESYLDHKYIKNTNEIDLSNDTPF